MTATQTELALATAGMDSTEEPRRVLPETLEGEGLVKQERGRADVLAHLGHATVESVNNIIRVVASQKTPFSWNDVKPLLPDGIKQTLAMPTMLNASGALMVNAAKLFGYRGCGYVKSTDPDARGRAIREWDSRKVDEWEGV